MANDYGTAGSQDFFSTGITVPNPNVPRYRNTFTARELRIDNQRTGVLEWEMIQYDFSGGLNSVLGDFNSISNRLSSSTCWTRFPGFVQLPKEFVVDSPTVANYKGLHHAQIFGVMALGVGSSANNCLYHVSNTSGIVARTFTLNGGSVTCLSPIVIGGNTSAEMLLVGASGGAAEILSDLNATPTSAGDMHADTNPLWGHIATGVPSGAGFINLLYNGTAISTILTTDAIGTQPTAVTSGIPGGGWHLGLSNARGRKEALWVWPKQNTTGGALATADTLCHIWATNLEGSDPQKIDLPLKNGITQACLYQDGCAYTDGKEIYLYKDGRSLNLGWSRERPMGSGAAILTYSVRGLMVNNERLTALTVERDSAVSATLGTVRIEEFDPVTWAWHGFSETLASRNPFGAAGSLPFSFEANRGIFATQDGSSNFNFYTQLHPVGGHNPFFDGNVFPASGQIVSPIWYLPGLIGVPSVLEEIHFGGFLYSGFTSTASNGLANVVITPGTQGQHVPTTTSALSETFRERDRTEDRKRRWPDNTDSFVLFQFTATLNRDTGATATSPNLVPLRFRGLAFPDGNVRSPRQVRGF